MANVSSADARTTLQRRSRWRSDDAVWRYLLVLGCLTLGLVADERAASACFGAITCSCNGGHPCNAGLSCISGSCTAAACTPRTCATLGANCGTPDNGCGTPLASCGTCTAPQTCGAVTQNVCGACAPIVACPGGKVCGSIPDGCGGSISCGTCAGALVCQSDNTCGSCTPATCAGLGKNCGSVSDGCGGTLACGSCGVAGDTCGGGGAANVCGQGNHAPTDFSAGALIIPMDNCYNPDYTTNSGPKNSGASCGPPSTLYSCYTGVGYPAGNTRLPFGALYLLVMNKIPVNVILNPQKTSLADADFSITPPAGSTRQTASVLSYSAGAFAVNTAGMKSGTNTVYYSGMPFVVDAPYAAQALQVLAQFSNPEFTTMPYHIANYPFTAPVLGTLATRPRPVLIDGAPLDTFFAESGIPDVVSNTYLTVTGAGANFTYQWPTSLGIVPTASPGCGAAAGGFQKCDALTYTAGATTNRIVDVLWNHNGDLNNWTGMGKFFQSSGVVMTLADATTWEGAYDVAEGGQLGGSISAVSNSAQPGPFCAAAPTGAASYYTSPGSATDYPSSDQYLQLGSMELFVKGGGGGDGSAYKFSAAPVNGTHALTNGAGNSAISGHPYVGGVQTTGDLVYLGSLNSWHGGSAGKDGGLRIMYNTLIADGDGRCGSGACVNYEFSRASAVGGLYGEYYRGTFEWPVPPDNNPGTILYVPPANTYPYSKGHLREYKAPEVNLGVGGNTSVTTTLTSYPLNSTCTKSDPLSPCNWDAGTLMKTYATRNVYVVTPSTTTLADAHTAALPAGWAGTNATLATKLTSGGAGILGGILGGIDYGTAAVIEPKPTGSVTVSNATQRPTIAYVGARDGMLHAFCVAPGAADVGDKCYSTYARGEEIWAIIPPGIQAAMITANASRDWSKINLGGAVRVADLKDTFVGESATGFRTILIVGSRELGFVDAFDVSNPNPSTINTDGFRFLWENNGATAVSGTSPTMGQTFGATIGLTDATNTTGVAIVTANPVSGNGIITYGMRVSDGKVFAYDSRAYSMTIPTAGGSSAAVPNDVPALATIVDVNADGNDETVFVTDFQGGVQKIVFTSTAFTSSTQAYTLSTSTNGCAATQACQPIGASASLVSLGVSGIGVIVASGGSDVSRAFPNTSFYIGGFNASTNAQLFSPLSMGTLATVPAGPVPAGGMPLRAYASPLVSGTALFADTTTLSVNTVAQLILPSLVPGQYGDVKRWNTINTAPSTSTSALLAGNQYSGGYASILQSNTSTGGSLVALSTNQGSTIVMSGGDSGLSNAAQHVGAAAGIVGRNFTTKAWFDLSN